MFCCGEDSVSAGQTGDKSNLSQPCLVHLRFCWAARINSLFQARNESVVAKSAFWCMEKGVNAPAHFS